MCIASVLYDRWDVDTVTSDHELALRDGMWVQPAIQVLSCAYFRHESLASINDLIHLTSYPWAVAFG